MLRLDRILVPLDFSPASLETFDYTLEFAANHQSRCVFLHVVSPMVPSTELSGYVDINRLISALKTQADEQMNRLRVRAMDAGVKASFRVRVGTTGNEILDAAKECKCDLILMARHNKGKLERWFMGSVTERVLRHSAIPLLITPEGEAAKLSPTGFKRIVVTTDHPQAPDDAMDTAVAFVQGEETRITLLHVIADWPSTISFPLGGVFIAPSQNKEEVREEMLKHLPRKPNVFALVESGVPYQEILDVLKNSGADLLVMNLHGRGVLERFLLGTTAERVIRGSPCPVLAIPPHHEIREKAA